MAALIDEFMPAWDHAERHAKRVDAAPDRVERVLRELTPRDLPLTRLLMAVRTLLAPRRLPAERTLLEALLAEGFAIIGEAPGEEIVIGVCGRPWQIRGEGIDPLAGADDFRAYDRPGSVKMTMNFALEPAGGGGTRFTTETRIAATDDDGRRAFRRYWRFIRPGSALIRRDILNAVARRAPERRSRQSPRSPPPRARTPRR